MLTVAMSALVSSSLVAGYADKTVRQMVKTHVQEVAYRFATRASVAILTRDKGLLTLFSDTVLGSTQTSQSMLPEVVAMMITDADKNTLFDAEGKGFPDRFQLARDARSDRDILLADQDNAIELVTRVVASDADHTDDQIAASSGDERLFGYLILKFDTRATERFITGLQSVAALSGLMIGALVIVWLRFRIDRLVAPLTALATAMGGAGTRSHGVRVVPAGTTELREIATAFNAMMSEIEQAHDNLEEAVRRATAEARVALDLARTESQAKSDLLTRVSHELRQPMNNILAYTATVGHKLAFVSAPVTDIAEDIERVERNAKQLKVLVEDLLLVRQMARERLNTRFAAFDVEQLIDDVVAEVSRVCIERGNTLTKHLEGPRTFVGDRDKLRIVLSNLLGNSAKFTAAGTITVRSYVTASMLTIIVKDTGIGIEDTEQENIFKMFQRGLRSREQAYPGVGVGLWIVRELVTLMEGTLILKSAPNQGCSFTVTIPVSRVEANG